MYRLLLALGVLTVIVGLAFFLGGFMVEGVVGRPAIVRGLAIIMCGFAVIAICDIQRRVVALRQSLEKMERDQGRLMEIIVRQGHTIDAFRAEMLNRYVAPPVQQIAPPLPDPDPRPQNGFAPSEFSTEQKLDEQPY